MARPLASHISSQSPRLQATLKFVLPQRANVTVLARSRETCRFLFVGTLYTCSSWRNEWIAKQHAGRNGAKRLTFSPAAEVYSPCRTSISAHSRGSSSVFRLRFNAFLSELIPLLRAVVLFGSLFFFPRQWRHTFDCCSFYRKKCTSGSTSKIRQQSFVSAL